MLMLGCLFRPDTLDPALLRPGRLDRKVEFGLPDLESRTQIFKIHTRTMNCERDIRFELLARLCPNSTGKDEKDTCLGQNFVKVELFLALLVSLLRHILVCSSLSW